MAHNGLKQLAASSPVPEMPWQFSLALDLRPAARHRLVSGVPTALATKTPLLASCRACPKLQFLSVAANTSKATLRQDQVAAA